MIQQKVTIEAPIKVIPSDLYLLIIEDADGVRHYWHKEHENKYGKFAEGQYDGWSVDITKKDFDRSNYMCIDHYN